MTRRPVRWTARAELLGTTLAGFAVCFAGYVLLLLAAAQR